MEKWGLKLTSAKVEVEVEAELGNKIGGYYLLQPLQKITTFQSEPLPTTTKNLFYMNIIKPAAC